MLNDNPKQKIITGYTISKGENTTIRDMKIPNIRLNILSKNSAIFSELFNYLFKIFKPAYKNI